MNEEMREKIIGEICCMVEKNPSLLKMLDFLDKLYRDVEKIKQELVQIKNDSQPNHFNRFQDLVETMLLSLSELEAKRLLEQKIQEQKEIIKHQEEQIKEAEAAYKQVAAARANEVNGVRSEMDRKDALLAEIKSGLAGFCDLPKTKRWQLILNEDNIISHLKGVEQKIDSVLGCE